jgi:hypothetical protein
MLVGTRPAMEPFTSRHCQCILSFKNTSQDLKFVTCLHNCYVFMCPIKWFYLCNMLASNYAQHIVHVLCWKFCPQLYCCFWNSISSTLFSSFEHTVVQKSLEWQETADVIIILSLLVSKLLFFRKDFLIDTVKNKEITHSSLAHCLRM